MPYDALLMFSDAQAVTTTAVSTNVLDLGVPVTNPRTGTALIVNHGGGNENPIVVKLNTAYAGLTSLQVVLQGSTDNSTFVDIASTRVTPLAELKAGYEFGFTSFPLRQPYRYLRLNYVVVGTGSGGTITANVADGFQTNGMV